MRPWSSRAPRLVVQTGVEPLRRLVVAGQPGSNEYPTSVVRWLSSQPVSAPRRLGSRKCCPNHDDLRSCKRDGAPLAEKDLSSSRRVVLLGPLRRRTALCELAASKTLASGMQAGTVRIRANSGATAGLCPCLEARGEVEGGLRTVSAARPRAARWELSEQSLRAVRAAAAGRPESAALAARKQKARWRFPSSSSLI